MLEIGITCLIMLFTGFISFRQGANAARFYNFYSLTSCAVPTYMKYKISALKNKPNEGEDE